MGIDEIGNMEVDKMNISIQSQKMGNLLQGFIQGEIDIHTAPIFKGELELIVLSDNLIIELDFSKVTYMDSSGLGVLIAFYKKVIKKNAYLKLVNISERITRMFKITGLSEIMDIDMGRATNVIIR